MKQKFLTLLLLLMTCFAAWGGNDVRWPDYVATEGTAGAKTAEDFDKLLDNNADTKWCVTSLGSPTYIEFDATRPIKPTGYVLTTGNDTEKYPGRNPKSWVIKGSNDGSNWTTIVTVTDGDMPTGNLESKTFTYDFGTAYRYWRFEVNSIVSGTAFQLSEFHFLVDYTNLKHVYLDGLQDIYYLAPGQGSVTPQFTVRDLMGQTPEQGTYWQVNYYPMNSDSPTTLNQAGTFRLIVTKGSSNYYSDSYETTIEVVYGLAGSGTQSDPYTISSLTDWYRFVASLNSGKTYAGEYVSLLNDLDLEINVILPAIMGDASSLFSGTFLGNNHTITQTASYSEQGASLFRRVNGATIKDLTVAGSLTSSQKFMGGLIGFVLGGDVVIENCHVTATLNSTVSGDGTSAGFVGYMSAGNIVFRDCSFTGSLVGENTTLWGGFMGWAETASTVNFSNCLFAPATLNVSGNNGNTFSRGRSGYTLSLNAAYYTQPLSTAQGTLVYAQQEGINKVVNAADGNTYYIRCTVSGLSSEYTYEGTPVLPTPTTVTADDGTALTLGTDYTLTYSDPTGRIPGEQTVTITGNGTTYVGTAVISYTLTRSSSLPELQLGDVNYDDRLSIADVTLLVNMARGTATANDLADVDGDNSVTIQDAELLVALILGKPFRIDLDAQLFLKTGRYQNLKPTLWPEGEYSPTYTWATSDPAVATVESNGRVTAEGSGTCVITCSAYGLTATCTVTVYDAIDYVDLGLPSGTLWAKRNVGATQEQDYGQYFAWGETEPKDTYSWATYFDSDNGSSSSFLKYNTANMALQPEDDAATVNLGAAWQMPTKAEMEELFNSQYTTVTMETVNYIKGFRITSNVNGNSIFLPAAGYNYGTYVVNTNYNLFYWTCELGSYRANANTLYGTVNDVSFSIDTNSRYYGIPVRPVLSQKAVRVSSITLSATELTIGKDERAGLDATLAPIDMETWTVTYTTSDATVATVDDMGWVTAVGLGTCTITCTALDGSGVSASCTVTVVPSHEYVDLGLTSGTLWATTNVGATSPTEAGQYFAWGETEPKSTYNWATYKWCNGTYNTLTRYCQDSGYGLNGYTDELTQLLPEDDAATVAWGSNWCMPTQQQWNELVNSSNLTREWVSDETTGAVGLRITSNVNNNSIFLPVTGFYDGSSLGYAEEYGCYWSRTIWADYTWSAWAIYFKGGETLRVNGPVRYYGRAVRPVRNQ